jgi:hypothetical protein
MTLYESSAETRIFFFIPPPPHSHATFFFPLASSFVLIFFLLLFEPKQLSRYSDWLRPGRLGFDFRQCSILSLLHSVQTDSGGHSASYLFGTGGSFPFRSKKKRSLKLTTHVYPMPRSGRMEL